MSKRRSELLQFNRLLVRQEGIAEREIAAALRSIGAEVASRYSIGSDDAVLDLVNTFEPAMREVLERRIKQTALLFGERTLGRLSALVDDGKSYYPVPVGMGPVRGRDGVDLFPRDGLNRFLEGKDFREIFERAILSWTNLRALEMAKSVIGTAREVVRGVLVQAHDEGLGEAGTVKLIREAVGKRMPAYAAARIARTEMHTASTVGTDEAARSTGLEMIKEWLTAEDARVRPSHAEADGQEVGLDEPFDVGGELIMIPGMGSAKNAINCRCAIVHHPVIGGEVIR